jgi:hypothetical protein
MAEMNLPTMIETGGGFGGMGAGLGGLIGGLVLGSIWGGNGWGGWGGNGRAMQAGADVALAGAVQNVSNQVQEGTISALQSANGTQMQIANSAAGVTAGINQNTIANLQGFAGVGQQMCCATGRLSQEIDQAGDQTVAAVNAANMNIASQGYENRIQAQAIANQLQNQHADLKATIIEQGCQDRETMRQIADQAVRDKLNECQNELAAQRAQNNLTAQLQNQTLYLISQLKTTTTTTAGA